MNSPAYQPTERRPIASRNTAVAAWAARRLAAARVSPNAISVAGMIAAIVGGGLFAATSYVPEAARWLWLGGALCMQLRLIANLLDGMVAIERRVASPVGELFNEVPDRISDAAAFIGLGYAVGGHVVWGLLAALAAVFTAYVRAMARVAGAPQDYCGPMAKPQRMLMATLIGVYCAAVPLAWQPQVPAIGGGIATIGLIVITLGSVLTALRRLWRAAAHLQKAHA